MTKKSKEKNVYFLKRMFSIISDYNEQLPNPMKEDNPIYLAALLLAEKTNLSRDHFKIFFDAMIHYTKTEDRQILGEIFSSWVILSGEVS